MSSDVLHHTTPHYLLLFLRPYDIGLPSNTDLQHSGKGSRAESFTMQHQSGIESHRRSQWLLQLSIPEALPAPNAKRQTEADSSS